MLSLGERGRVKSVADTMGTVTTGTWSQVRERSPSSNKAEEGQRLSVCDVLWALDAETKDATWCGDGNGKIYDLDSRLSRGSRAGGRCLHGLREAGGQGSDSCTGAGFARLGLCSNTRGSLGALVSWARGEGRGEGIKKGCPTPH